MNRSRRALAYLFTPVIAGVIQTILLVATAPSRGPRIESRYWLLLLIVMFAQSFALVLAAWTPAWYSLRMLGRSSVSSYALAGLLVGVFGVLVRVALGFGSPPGNPAFGVDLTSPARLWEFAITAIAWGGAGVAFRTISGSGGVAVPD